MNCLSNQILGLNGTRSLAALILFLLAILQAQAQPEITKQPADARDVAIGSTVTFSVDAVSASGAIKYQWRRNGVNIPGATTNTYTVSSVQFTDAGNYLVTLADQKGATNSSPAKLTVNVPVVAPRDNFAEAYELLPLGSGVLRTSNTNATRELNEPLHAGEKGGKSIWFKVHPGANGVMTINSAGSDFDTLVAVYTGRSVDQLTPLGIDINDDDNGGFLAGKLTFNLPLSTDPLEYYYIALDGFGGDSGNVVLSWRFEASTDLLPLITTRPERRTIRFGSDLNLVVGYEGQNATANWLFNNVDLFIRGNSLGISKIDDAKVGLYGMRCETAAGRQVFMKPANIQINIQADGSADTNAFTFDKFRHLADAAKVRSQSSFLFGSSPQASSPRPTGGGGPAAGYTSTQIFSTINSTKEPGEPNIASEPGGASEWFSYQPTNSGTLHINTDGSSYDTVLGVYTGPGDSFATLVESASDNDSGSNGKTSRVRFPAAANTIYYIAVDGVGGAKGTVRLSLNFGDPPTITTPLQDQIVPTGSNATFSVSASGSTALSYRWQFQGSNIAGATTPAYTITNVNASKTGDYTVLVSNVVGTAASNARLDLSAAPQIVTNPASRTVPAGTNATLTVGVSGSPVLTYRWHRNETALSDGAGIGGAATSSLTISNFQTLNEGAYHVVVSNSFGTVPSVPAQLMVDAPMRFGSYGPGTNRTFQLQLVGSSGTSYVLEASTNLVNWNSLLTNFSSDGYLIFGDTDATNYSFRFYRARGGP